MGKKLRSPPRIDTDQVIAINSFDDNSVNSSIVLYFTLRFDDVLDPEKLRAAFEKLLNRDGWRKLGARLRLNVSIDHNRKFRNFATFWILISCCK